MDEINQGMDEKNEKRVWEILVDSANEHSAQFFYLAPKYPHDLDFERSMHIHMCFNGDVELRSKKKYINVDEVIQLLQNKWDSERNI